ncbi:MAG: ADOP family duplicated permease [Acidobacteriia bacterium]|nr:ADOP family duplicated permease [Terriglobia bacterium]
MDLLALRHAFRALRHRPAFALAAILTLALGVGANIAVYQVVYGVLIQPLPFRDPARLVQLWESTPALPQLQVTGPDFDDWRNRAHAFEQMAAYTLAALNQVTLLSQGEPEKIHATMASYKLSSTLGTRPLLGRAFTADEERAKARVGLLSESLWRRKFGGAPDIIGRQIRLETGAFTVIGVVSTPQAFPAWADFWMPLSLIDPGLVSGRKFHTLEVVARLRPGVRASEAASEVQAVARSLGRQHPATNGIVGAYLIPLQREVTDEVRPSILLVWAAVGLVLLIACGNLAHLVLARMVERRREIEIRAALGAGAGHIIRQVLAESLLLAAAGGALGLALAAGATEALRRVAGDQIPRLDQAGLHAPVWGFAIAVSVIGAVLVAIPACWQTTRLHFARGTPAGRSVTRVRSRLSSLLIGAEVALALVVVAGAVLLGRSFHSLLNEDPGFGAGRVLTVQAACRCPNPYQPGPFFGAQVLPALRALPGVDAAATVNSVPMSLGPTEHSRFATRYGVDGRTFPAGDFPVAQYRWVSPDYFRTLGIPLHRGRWLTEADRQQPVLLINEALARRWFPRQDPTGQRLILGVVDPQQTRVRIAGVVGDVRELGLDQEAPPIIYGISTLPDMTVVVKTNRDPAELMPAIREALQRADPGMAVSPVRPLESYVRESLARRRLALGLLAAFGALAAILIAAGIYSLLAYAVNARLRELGVRAAVGATPAMLLRMILREAASVAMPGLIAGSLGFLVAARWMKSLVYQLSPVDPISIVTAAVALFALTLVSAWLPGRRASRADAATALRAE